MWLVHQLKNGITEKLGVKYNEVILNSLLTKENNSIKSNYFRDKLKISKEHKTFLYIGAFTRGRNLVSIVDAFCDKRITSNLILLGYGPFDEKTLQKIKNNHRMHIHDAVPHEHVLEI